jgi:hypothetical protein
LSEIEENDEAAVKVPLKLFLAPGPNPQLRTVTPNANAFRHKAQGWQSLPWAEKVIIHQPQGGCAFLFPMDDATPLGLLQ